MISVVIPCYRSEKTIAGVVGDVRKVLEDNNEDYEMILVDDGSPDGVWPVMKELAMNSQGHVKSVLLARNFGQHSALMAGYRMAAGDIIISMDDDGQSSPEGIMPLINKIREGYDVVYARYPEMKESLFRRLGSWANYKMSESLLGKPEGIKATSYNAIRKFVIDEMIKYENSYPYIAGLVFRTTKNIADIEIEHKDREVGVSGYTFFKLIKLWMNGFTAFSEKPLRIASGAGIICAIAGFVYMLVTIIRRLVNPSIQLGYSSLMAVILFVGGILMMLLGIIGEYIGRIYISINNAPQYVIREIAEDKNGTE